MLNQFVSIKGQFRGHRRAVRGFHLDNLLIESQQVFYLVFVSFLVCLFNCKADSRSHILGSAAQRALFTFPVLLEHFLQVTPPCGFSSDSSVFSSAC